MIMSRGQTLVVQQTSALLGVKLPKRFSDDVAAASAVLNAAEEIGDSSAALNAAVLDAIAKGADYRTDPAVTGLLLDAALVRVTGIGEAARARADQTIANALVAHADPSCPLGATPSSHTLKHSPQQSDTRMPTNIDDGAAVKAAGDRAMLLSGPTQAAVKCWASAVGGFVALAHTARITANKGNAAILTDVGFDVLEPVEVEARSTGTRIDAWLLARHGVPLSLARIGTYMERVAVHEQQRQAAALQAQQRANSRAASLA